MRLTAFALRNTKEILRDKLNLAFGLGFPVVLLLLLTLIESNVPVSIFSIQTLAPGIAVFGLSFVSLFSGMLIAKDRESALMTRLFTSPLTSRDFILGYTLPLIPLAVGQIVVCFLAALLLGLPLGMGILFAIVVLIPCTVLFVSIGLLCGSLFTDRQVGGICGALLTNLSAWLSGTWFDLELVGGVFARIANLFPFVHAVNSARFAMAGDYERIFPDLWWVIGYGGALLLIAILVFRHKMKCT